MSECIATKNSLNEACSSEQESDTVIPVTNAVSHKIAADEEAVGEEAADCFEAKKKKKPESKYIDAKKKPEEFRNYTASSERFPVVRAFYEEQHKKQTYAFAAAMKEKYSKFDMCQMPVWQMCQFLDVVIDDSDPDTDLTQMAHAIQTGEMARRICPGEDYDWFHVVAFIHDLGKVLSVTNAGFGMKGLPMWAVAGDNFPLGCAFEPSVIFHEFFAQNPDACNPKYNSKLGVYSEGCGLKNVAMSWSHDEYMYSVAASQSSLPTEALYILRFHSFYALHQCGGYQHLLDQTDREMLPWLKRFQKCDLYSKSHALPPVVDEVIDYYKAKILKFFPETVSW